LDLPVAIVLADAVQSSEKLQARKLTIDEECGLLGISGRSPRGA
jgi:hypothetical protein